jgi:programmed cell death 6-interacting protein
VIEAGGVDELERFVRELPDLLHRNTDLLSEAERMLMEEAESDSTLRAQHEARWNSTTSDKLTRDILCQCHQLPSTTMPPRQTP